MTAPASVPQRTRNVATRTDAREFGLHMKQGGWRLGLLVARNVARAPGRVSIETLAPKTNATRFAQAAGTSNDRVLRHLNAWEAAADAGLVPHANQLSPGVDIDIDADQLPAWTQFYRPEVRRARPLPSPVTVTRPDDEISIAERQARALEMAEAARLAREAQEAAVRARRDQEIAAEIAAGTAAEREVDAADRRYRMARTHNRTDDGQAVLGGNAVHAEIYDEVQDLITKTKWYTRRLFDLARDPDWQVGTGSRVAAAEEIRALASQLNLVADLAADPDSGRLTDEAATQLLES